MDTEGLYVIQQALERRSLDELVLVFESRDVPHDVFFRNGQWWLVVPDESAARAVREVAAYRNENVAVPRPSAPPIVDGGVWGVLGYLATIWFVFLRSNDLSGRTLRGLGRLDAEKVLDGELWRTVTALTLHADLAHIASNSLFGGLFGWLLGRSLGSGVAWFAVVVAAALGNLLNAMLRPIPFFSLGASTATFAAVGVGAVFVWRTGYFRSFSGVRRVAPLAAAFGLFAFIGTGGGNTDVLAHFLGLLAGFFVGQVVVRNQLQDVGLQGQRFFGLSAFLVILLAWAVAV